MEISFYFLGFLFGGCGAEAKVDRGRPIRILTGAKNILEQTKLLEE